MPHFACQELIKGKTQTNLNAPNRTALLAYSGNTSLIATFCSEFLYFYAKKQAC